MKTFWCDCVNPEMNLETLDRVIDEAEEITREEFFNEIADEGLEERVDEFPDNYTFWKYEDIYFFTWSAIEHFYREEN